MEEAWTPKQGKPTCGHIPGNWFYAFNTGLFAVRNRPAPRKLMASWVMMLTDPGKQHDEDGHGVDDQLALNLLFDSDLSLNGGTEAISEGELQRGGGRAGQRAGFALNGSFDFLSSSSSSSPAAAPDLMTPPAAPASTCRLVSLPRCKHSLCVDPPPHILSAAAALSCPPLRTFTECR
jgi:hypothetical protein